MQPAWTHASFAIGILRRRLGVRDLEVDNAPTSGLLARPYRKAHWATTGRGDSQWPMAMSPLPVVKVRQLTPALPTIDLGGEGRVGSQKGQPTSGPTPG